MNLDTAASGRPADMSDTEWQLRLQLAACCQVFDWLGWTEAIFNHISIRLPGPERHYLVNPFGLHYAEVTASSILKVDLRGERVAPSPHPGNPAGFIIHGAVHAARDDAHCVMHTHTTTGMAVACSAGGLSHDNFYGAQLTGRVAYHDFEGITVHADEQPRLVASLGDKPALILRSHGLLVAERSLPHAFWLMWTLQRACDLQCMSAPLGPAVPVPDDVRRQSAWDGEHFDPEGRLGEKMLAALVRRMEMDRNRCFTNFRQ